MPEPLAAALKQLGEVIDCACAFPYRSEEDVCASHRALALVAQALAERENLLRDALKDFDEDARGYCCIRDETVARLRALLPKEAPRGA